MWRQDQDSANHAAAHDDINEQTAPAPFPYRDTLRLNALNAYRLMPQRSPSTDFSTQTEWPDTDASPQVPPPGMACGKDAEDSVSDMENALVHAAVNGTSKAKPGKQLAMKVAGAMKVAPPKKVAPPNKVAPPKKVAAPPTTVVPPPTEAALVKCMKRPAAHIAKPPKATNMWDTLKSLVKTMPQRSFKSKAYHMAEKEALKKGKSKETSKESGRRAHKIAVDMWRLHNQM